MMDVDRDYLRQAARLALRGHGGAEPNPMVGCVIVRRSGEVVGEGYHRRCGGPHAEVVALRRAGARARGTTVYVTLEPCAHQGRTGPCTAALIEAGVARVVIGRLDENPGAAGGVARLREAGIDVEVADDDPVVRSISEPFLHRVRSGLPWVIAKWAQSVDGRIATRTGQSRWISSPRSRAMVHRQRGRVDALLTGIGTVLADDPMLTPRCRRPRRIPRRIVVDPLLAIPSAARVVTTAREVPTTIVCAPDIAGEHADQVRALEASGVEVLPGAEGPGGLDLGGALRVLTDRHDLSTVMVEAGGGLLGSLFGQGLVNEAWVFVAPIILGDDEAVSCVRGLVTPELAGAVRFDVAGVHRRGGDVLVRMKARG